MRMLLDFVDSNSKNRFFFTSLQHDSVSGPAALGDAVVLKTGANVSFDQIFLKPFTRRKMRNLVKKWGQEANLDEEERSEEHTSELQSLMRISYAVFCLKKKTSNKSKQTQKVVILPDNN